MARYFLTHVSYSFRQLPSTFAPDDSTVRFHLEELSLVSAVGTVAAEQNDQQSK